MLILQRRPNEAVLVGDDIRIVVLKSDGGGVRLGIEAPGHFSILREEILEQVLQENVLASRKAMELGEMEARTPEGARDGHPARQDVRASLRK